MAAVGARLWLGVALHPAGDAQHCGAMWGTVLCAGLNPSGRWCAAWAFKPVLRDLAAPSSPNCHH